MHTEWKEKLDTFTEWIAKLDTREAHLNERNMSLTAKEEDPTGVKKLQKDNDKLKLENYALESWEQVRARSNG